MSDLKKILDYTPDAFIIPSKDKKRLSLDQIKIGIFGLLSNKLMEVDPYNCFKRTLELLSSLKGCEEGKDKNGFKRYTFKMGGEELNYLCDCRGEN